MSSREKSLEKNNLLHTHMGDEFFKLSPFLQKLHSGKNVAQGKVTVKNGVGFAWLLCRLMRFPKAASQVLLRVDCEHKPDQIIWKRLFDKHQMNSVFYQQGEDLVEHLNGMRLYVKAVEINGALHYHFHKAKFLGLPVPSFLAPKVLAYEMDVDGKCHFTVEVTMFLLGKVISYSGVLALMTEEMTDN